MSKRRKRPEVARIAALVGEAEAESYMALHAASVAFTRDVGDRFFGGGGIELLDPVDVRELDGHVRPGLVVFATELAGDWVCWDVRRGRPTDGARPSVVYVDHEIGFAEPFGRHIGAAFVHVVARALVGAQKSDVARAAAAWVSHFGPMLDAPEAKLLARFARAVSSTGARPVFANDDAARRAVRPLLPPGRRWLGLLPPTHVPLLAPDDDDCLDDAIARYEEAVALYRELVHDEGRAAFAWYLAAAARGLSDVLLRRRKYKRAAAAAREAIAHYAPIVDAGDGRAGMMLAFAHRVVATVDAREKDWQSAYEHATRALELSEVAVFDQQAAVTGLGHAAAAWEQERAGRPRDAQRELSLAVRHLAPYADRTPPHALGDHAARVARLAGARRARRG